MNKQKAIDKFIEDYQGKTFSEGTFEPWLRERVTSLVEEIYKEELELSDDKFKENEQCRKYYDELLTETQNFDHMIRKEFDKAIEEAHGGGNGKRLLTQLRDKLK